MRLWLIVGALTMVIGAVLWIYGAGQDSANQQRDLQEADRTLRAIEQKEAIERHVERQSDDDLTCRLSRGVCETSPR